MLHAVAVRPRQVVRDEGVGVALERRVFAEHVPGFSDDGFDVADQAVHVGVRARVMHRDTKDRRPPIVGHRERPQRERAELRRAVHQVLQVGSRKGQRRRCLVRAASRRATTCRWDVRSAR